MNILQNSLRLGIDVGSTTVKLIILDAEKSHVRFSCYKRHNARQADTICQLLKEAAVLFPENDFRIAVCGSGGRPVAKALGAHYIQEVVANASAIRSLYPEARTAIELGGQDAKIVFFHYDKATDRLLTSDMRMNGSCAGGTGAFIDEIATLLNVPTEGFESLARKGRTVYDISGRCGVFAKTDIQPLLISGAAREDIALSTLHAIAKQTIGGLSQGLELTPPLIFEGGPFTFNPTLVKVFMERLKLKNEDVIIPEHSETIVARGTAIALDDLFPQACEGEKTLALLDAARILKKAYDNSRLSQTSESQCFFSSPQEQKAFENRHLSELKPIQEGKPDETGCLRVYLGIDSGSTTSKIVLIDEQENVIDRFYQANRGDPLPVVKDGLLAILEKYKKKNVKLKVLGLGTTGYGELLFAQALGADYHTVETVAHSEGCKKFIPDVSFILDIGGQDMKAIWMNNGIATNIVLNEACSSGCGSFLESFAASLGIAVDQIAENAFRSKHPAKLGSRCTVFMNSTIINEQRNGKQADDIMAGLCRSIIENVFTKVIRISNTQDLGDKIVVQGGTFRNQAVLRALEEYLNKEVILAPYPGEMGAFGAAIYAKHAIEEKGYENGISSSFIGFERLKNLRYTKQAGVRCPLCANHCSRTIMTFSTGVQYVTGNRCDRGLLVLTDQATAKPQTNAFSKSAAASKTAALEAAAAEQSAAPLTAAADSQTADINLKAAASLNKIPIKESNKVPDMFQLREKLLFAKYPYKTVTAKKKLTIGLPRVLEFWDSMPFWTTFFGALGYNTKLSHPSSRKMYEQGLSFVSSDTICFPAKLVHGHIQDLAKQGVDRIFMPYIMHMPPQGTDKLSPYVCPVIMGYPMVVRNHEMPERRYHIPFDTPQFNWYSERDRKLQICNYAKGVMNVSEEEAENAYKQAEAAIKSFQTQLVNEAKQILQKTREQGSFAIVLAGRPYHTDPLISHNISGLFTKKGIAVLTVDSLPGLNEVDLRYTRAEITNDFHTRMMSGAMLAAAEPSLEYVQIVSFGCGHDAVLSDEVTRIMTERAGKPPLILKVDESDATGSLSIRVQSFIETIQKRRGQDKLKANNDLAAVKQALKPLSDPYTVKFHRKDKKLRTIIIPNISGPIAKMLSAVMQKKGFRVQTVPVGGSEEIRLGKKYTHNDICFPCQMVIGEALHALINGNFLPGEAAVAMVKFQCDCRMAQYVSLLRKAMDSAGFSDVPIISTDFNNTKDLQPGVSIMTPETLIEAIWGIIILDILDDLRRKIRPYEINKGETKRVFDNGLDYIFEQLQSSPFKAVKAFKKVIKDFCEIPYDRDVRKPRVFVTGEILVTFHEGTNFNIEDYLVDNGMEAIFPRVADQFRKDFLVGISQREDFKVKQSRVNYIGDKVFNFASSTMEKIALEHPLYHKATPPNDIYEGVNHIIPKTLSCGEGWLIPGEIVHHAAEGVHSFVILQPFGCLPNHVCGRGVIKRIKEDYPAIQILPIDLDPDTSFANVENRLQMLIMNERSRQTNAVKNTKVKKPDKNKKLV